MNTKERRILLQELEAYKLLISNDPDAILDAVIKEFGELIEQNIPYCTNCDGTGQINYGYENGGPGMSYATCHICKGTGHNEYI